MSNLAVHDVIPASFLAETVYQPASSFLVGWIRRQTYPVASWCMLGYQRETDGDGWFFKSDWVSSLLSSWIGLGVVTSPQSLFGVRDGVVIFLPVNDRLWHSHHAALQTQRRSFCHARVLQLLHKLRRLFHLFLCMRGETGLSVWGGTSVVSWWWCQSETDLTHDSQLQTERTLARFIGGDAGVRPVIGLSQRIDNQRMNPILSHQHPMADVRIYGPSVEEPHDLGMR